MLEEMKDQELDRIFSRDADLVPSSGFASAVMDAVRDEASAPPPIPFPWKRALPGIAAWALALAFLFVAVFRQSAQDAPASSAGAKFLAALAPALRAAQAVGAGWIAAALLLSYVSVKLALLFARVGRVP
jgi:hypothetical protein